MSESAEVWAQELQATGTLGFPIARGIAPHKRAKLLDTFAAIVNELRDAGLSVDASVVGKPDAEMLLITMTEPDAAA